MLREHQVDKYIAMDGEICPYCFSTNVWTYKTDLSVEYVHVRTHAGCHDCTKSWINVYTLNDIEETKGGW